MKGKTRYTDEPMEVGPPIRNFLPPPDKLIFKEDAHKVTLTLSARTVFFFKKEAEKHGVPYQRMIRRLLDAYVAAFTDVDDSRRANVVRAEEPRGSYRTAVKRRR
jgi:hypothetical protein